jgi:hypothetical protein
MRSWIGFVALVSLAGCALVHEQDRRPGPLPWQGDGGPVAYDAPFDVGNHGEDVGPMRCGGLLNVGCPSGFFCHFEGGSCGVADQPGLCEPEPSACPDPGGTPVCGCDGHDYWSECAANMGGIDVAHAGVCETTQPMLGVSATPTCGPTDGPAWTFLLTNGAPMCGRAGGMVIEVWDALESAAPGSVYDLRVTAQGHAALCPAPSRPCLPLTGTLTLDSLVPGVSGSFSFDLVDPAGGHVRGDHVMVGLWCGSQRQCG